MLERESVVEPGTPALELVEFLDADQAAAAYKKAGMEPVK